MGSTPRTARRSPATSRTPRRRARQRHGQRRAAGQARGDLLGADLGDARSPGAQPGPRRRTCRPGPRRAVPAVLLPRARRDRGQRAGNLRALPVRADQARSGHPDAAGHRRPDPHDRRRRGRERGHLRTRQGGVPRRALAANAITAGYRRVSARSSTRTSSPSWPRSSSSSSRTVGCAGIRAYARHGRAGLAVHRRRGDAGDPRHDGPHTRSSAPRARSGPASAGASGRSTSWGRRAGSSACRGRSC